MEMFSTPVLLRNSENQENTMRKNGPDKILQRKPFLDRPVNSKTPVVEKLQKGSHTSKIQMNTHKTESMPEEDVDASDYIFSYKDEDIDCDVWPKPTLLGTEGIIKILRNYTSNNQVTPPPSPIGSPIKMESIFWNFPDDLLNHRDQDDVSFEIIDEVDIPNLDNSIDF